MKIEDRLLQFFQNSDPGWKAYWNQVVALPPDFWVSFSVALLTLMVSVLTLLVYFQTRSFTRSQRQIFFNTLGTEIYGPLLMSLDEVRHWDRAGELPRRPWPWEELKNSVPYLALQIPPRLVESLDEFSILYEEYDRLKATGLTAIRQIVRSQFKTGDEMLEVRFKNHSGVPLKEIPADLLLMADTSPKSYAHWLRKRTHEDKVEMEPMVEDAKSFERSFSEARVRVSDQADSRRLVQIHKTLLESASELERDLRRYLQKNS